jgi:uncharacterized protein YeaO (DUF488 family)
MDTLPRLRASMLAGRPPDDQRRLRALFADAWETGCLSEERIRTGCVYEVQPTTTYDLCVPRFDPRNTGRRQIPFHEWWPELAPTAPLVIAYRTLDTHGQRAISWAAFAQSYFAELDALPTRLLVSLVEGLCDLPCRYTSVTLLGCEHPTASDEGRVRCHRRLLRLWLLGQADATMDHTRRERATSAKGAR